MANRTRSKRKWEPGSVKLNTEKVSDERFEQLLAEVGEVLYKRLQGKLRIQDEQTNLSSSTEPFLRFGSQTA